ncbi:IS200/IS605 family transposase [Erwinia psidii]|uniref:IS200/IS605 family transposase n=1 Tax=Erwinia psidii TaxID=69224 RepID=UPI00397E1F49
MAKRIAWLWTIRRRKTPDDLMGIDKDYIHFLIQTVPTYSVKKIVNIIKRLTARDIFKRCSHVKKTLWDSEFWTDGYFASTIGKHSDENITGKHVKNQYLKYQNPIQIIS